MTTWILAVLGLWVVHTVLPSALLLSGAGLSKEVVQEALKGRDKMPDGTTLSKRADRARWNLLEAMPVFLALALLLVAQDNASPWGPRGAMVFFGARVLYLPAYLSAILGLRSAVWAVSLVGLGMMAGAVVGVL